MSSFNIFHPIDSFKEKAGLKRTRETIIRKINSQNILIIRARSYSLGNVLSFMKNAIQRNIPKLIEFASESVGAQFEVETQDGKRTFFANFENDGLTDRDILGVYEVNDGCKKIGTVNQHLFSKSLSPFEKESNKCTVMLGRTKLCELKKYVSFGELKFETLSGSARVEAKDEWEYSIYYKRKKIAELHEIPIKLKDEHVDKYVLEYVDEEYLHVAIMMAMAIENVNT